jgi:hypothetical protein
MEEVQAILVNEGVFNVEPAAQTEDSEYRYIFKYLYISVSFSMGPDMY